MVILIAINNISCATIQLNFMQYQIFKSIFKTLWPVKVYKHKNK